MNLYLGELTEQQIAEYRLALAQNTMTAQQIRKQLNNDEWLQLSAALTPEERRLALAQITGRPTTDLFPSLDFIKEIEEQIQSMPGMTRAPIDILRKMPGSTVVPTRKRETQQEEIATFFKRYGIPITIGAIIFGQFFS